MGRFGQVANSAPKIEQSHSSFTASSRQVHRLSAQPTCPPKIIHRWLTVGFCICLALQSMTGALWRSAFVAAVFAIHPLHVESVAWVAERKDVLSGVFFMLTLLAYAHYARAPSIGRYLTVVFVFALGLMSKPMLVTLPFVLLLLDYWPLNRIGRQTSDIRSQLLTLVLEKIPLVGLSAVSSIVTFLAQKYAIGWAEELPIWSRINNA